VREGAISTQQLRFWNELKMLRGQMEYLNLYILYCERIDRLLKMFLAVSSSGSIAAWAVWQQFTYAWGAIIAGSQVVSAVKAYLPFEQRLKATTDVSSKLEGLFLQWETTWQKVAAGELAEDEIASRIARLKQAKINVVEISLRHCPLPDKPALRHRAAEMADSYFHSIYEIGDPRADQDSSLEPQTSADRKRSSRRAGSHTTAASETSQVVGIPPEGS
jgi:hypothetical protein